MFCIIVGVPCITVDVLCIIVDVFCTTVGIRCTIVHVPCITGGKPKFLHGTAPDTLLLETLFWKQCDDRDASTMLCDKQRSSE